MPKSTSENVDLSTLNGWEGLQPEEQSSIRKETEQAIEDIENERKSRLSFGKHLTSVHDILKPKGMWIEYLERVFHMSVATAYRYMELYRSINEKLPPPLLVIALRRGLEIRPKSLNATPIPKTDDPKKLEAFFEKISRPTPRIVSIETASSEDVLKECVNFVLLRARKVHGRGRGPFLKHLVGILIGQLTPSSEGEQSYQSLPMPDSFLVLRGRPRKIAA